MSSFILFALATSIVLTLAYDTGGRIFFFSTSITKFSGCPPNYVLYTATKGAIEQMVRTLSKDLGARGITVNAIAPGAIEVERYFTFEGYSRDDWGERIPAGRVGFPNDIGPFAAFLCSPAADYITGQIVWVDGGMTSRLGAIRR